MSLPPSALGGRCYSVLPASLSRLSLTPTPSPLPTHTNLPDLAAATPSPQVVKHLPDAHVLACAPSNSGADLLCQRLRTHLPSSIYRLLAPSRDIRMVPEDIKVPGEVQEATG